MFTDMYLYYCKECDRFEAHDEQYFSYKCPVCCRLLKALGVTVEEWNNITDEEMRYIINNPEPFLPSDFVPAYKNTSKGRHIFSDVDSSSYSDSEPNLHSYQSVFSSSKPVNRFVILKDTNKIYDPGEYKAGTNIDSGEYYFWGKDIYIYDSKGLILNVTGHIDCYFFLEKRKRIIVENAKFTPIDNIEYSYKDGDILEPNHIYRGQMELPQGVYRILSKQASERSRDSNGICTIRSYSSIKIFEDCFPFASSDYVDLDKYSSFSVDDCSNYIVLSNCTAQLSERRLITSWKTLGRQRSHKLKTIEKLLVGKNDSSMIIDGDLFYFYVSAPDPIAEMYIKKYYKDCSALKNPLKDDISINYRFSVPQKDKDEICLILYLIMNNKLSLPRVNGVVIRDLFLLAAGRYSGDYKRAEMEEISDQLGINDVSKLERFVKQYKKIYPPKLIVDAQATVTYAMHLSPEYDKRYYYHAYNNSKFYGNMYQKRLNELEEKGILNAKWKSEYGAYLLIKEDYPDAKYQYRASWLDQQSLDIFIPSLNIGVEYQGKQHYEASSFFGGEDGLEERQRLDSEKKQRCDGAGVTLIEWKYDIPVTRENYNKSIKPLLLNIRHT